MATRFIFDRFECAGTSIILNNHSSLYPNPDVQKHTPIYFFSIESIFNSVRNSNSNVGMRILKIGSYARPLMIYNEIHSIG